MASGAAQIYLLSCALCWRQTNGGTVDLRYSICERYFLTNPKFGACTWWNRACLPVRAHQVRTQNFEFVNEEGFSMAHALTNGLQNNAQQGKDQNSRNKSTVALPPDEVDIAQTRLTKLLGVSSMTQTKVPVRSETTELSCLDPMRSIAALMASV